MTVTGFIALTLTSKNGFKICISRAPSLGVPVMPNQRDYVEAGIVIKRDPAYGFRYILPFLEKPLLDEDMVEGIDYFMSLAALQAAIPHHSQLLNQELRTRLVPTSEALPRRKRLCTRSLVPDIAPEPVLAPTVPIVAQEPRRNVETAIPRAPKVLKKKASETQHQCCVQGLIRHRCFGDTKLRYVTAEIRRKLVNFVNYKRLTNCLHVLKEENLYVCICMYRIIWKSTAASFDRSDEQEKENYNAAPIPSASDFETRKPPPQEYILNEIPPTEQVKRRRVMSSLKCALQGKVLGFGISHNCHQQENVVLHRLTDDLRTKLGVFCYTQGAMAALKVVDCWNPTPSDLICEDIIRVLNAIPLLSLGSGECRLVPFYEHNCNARENNVRVSDTFRNTLVQYFEANNRPETVAAVKTWGCYSTVCLNSFKILQKKEYCDLRLDVLHTCTERTAATILLSAAARSRLLTFLAQKNFFSLAKVLTLKAKIFLCQTFYNQLMDLKPGFCAFKKTWSHDCNESNRITNVARGEYPAFQMFLNALTDSSTPGVIRATSSQKVTCCKNLRQDYVLWLAERNKTAKCMFTGSINHICGWMHRNHGLRKDKLIAYSRAQRLPGLIPLINQAIFIDMCCVVSSEVKRIVSPQSCPLLNVFEHVCAPDISRIIVSIPTDLMRAQLSMYFQVKNRPGLVRKAENYELQFICGAVRDSVAEMVIQLPDRCALTHVLGHSCTGELQVATSQLQTKLRQMLRTLKANSIAKVLLALEKVQICRGLRQDLEQSNERCHTWGQLLGLDLFKG